MTRSEFIKKYDGKEWKAANGELRVYLDLELAMPRRSISRAVRNSVKIWLDENDALQIKGQVDDYADEVKSDAATII